MPPPSPTTRRKPRKSSSGKLNTTLYASSSLGDETALRHAISVFEKQLQSSQEEMYAVFTSFEEHTLEYLISGKHHLFGFVYDYCSSLTSIVAIDDRVFDELKRRLLTGFPEKAHHFPTSLSSKLLSRFSSYFHEVDSFSSDVNSHSRTLQLASEALESISLTIFPETVVTKDDESSKRGKKKSWRNRAPTIEEKSFQVLRLSVPTTRDEASTTTSKLFNILQDILKVCLELKLHTVISHFNSGLS